MSNKYKSSKEVPNDVLIARLNELADSVTKGRAGQGDFTMRIPAECDRDADLVLSEAAERLAHVERLEGALKMIALYDSEPRGEYPYVHLLKKRIKAMTLTAGNALKQTTTPGG